VGDAFMALPLSEAGAERCDVLVKYAEEFGMLGEEEA